MPFDAPPGPIHPVSAVIPGIPLMSASAIKAGEAFVKVWANDAEAQKTLKSLQARVKAFADDVSAMGVRVMAVGAAVTAPALEMAISRWLYGEGCGILLTTLGGNQYDRFD